MANTTNLNLVKPAGTDYALVSVINGNWDIIDSKVGAIPQNESVQSQITALNNQIAKIKTEDIYTSSESGWDTAIENYADSLPNDGNVHIGFIQRSGAGIVICIIQKISDGNYASVLSFGYWRDPYYYTKNNGVWTAKKITLNT